MAREEHFNSVLKTLFVSISLSLKGSCPPVPIFCALIDLKALAYLPHCNSFRSLMNNSWLIVSLDYLLDNKSLISVNLFENLLNNSCVIARIDYLLHNSSPQPIYCRLAYLIDYLLKNSSLSLREWIIVYSASSFHTLVSVISDSKYSHWAFVFLSVSS